MPRYRGGELRTFGEFMRDYLREEGAVVERESFADRADRRLNDRTFGDFRKWLDEQPGERVQRELEPLERIGPREVDYLFSRSREALAASAAQPNPRAAATVDLPQGAIDAPATGSRSPARSSVQTYRGWDTRRNNRVARNLKIAANASAADARRFQPEYSERTIYGTVYQVGFHSPKAKVSKLRSLKRREVLFAKGIVRRRNHSVR